MHAMRVSADATWQLWTAIQALFFKRLFGGHGFQSAGRAPGPAMLAIEKENLLAETNQDIALLREKELRYYVDHIGGIQTMATLLAGFAFTALVQSDSLHLDVNAVWFRHSVGTFSQHRNATTDDAITQANPVYTLMADPWEYFSFVMHAGELASTVFCLGEMLHVLVISLIARLLGMRLALRGPDGSIIRATRHLAIALASTTRTFFKGLQYFLLSVVFYALRGQHPLIALLMIGVIFKYWRGQGRLASELSLAFKLEKGVTTAFIDERNYNSERRLPPLPTSHAHAECSCLSCCCSDAHVRLARFFPGDGVDTNGDGVRDSIAVDVDGDGIPDIVVPNPERTSDRLSEARNQEIRRSWIQQTRKRERDQRPWWKRLFDRLEQYYGYLSPVGHRLNLLFDEVSRDFEGEASIANAMHRSPQKATQHLIMRQEKKGWQNTPLPLSNAPQPDAQSNDVILGPLSSRRDILAEFTKAVHL